MDIKEALEILNEDAEQAKQIFTSLAAIVDASKTQPQKLMKATRLAGTEFGKRELQNTLDVIDLIKDVVISN